MFPRVPTRPHGLELLHIEFVELEGGGFEAEGTACDKIPSTQMLRDIAISGPMPKPIQNTRAQAKIKKAFRLTSETPHCQYVVARKAHQAGDIDGFAGDIAARGSDLNGVALAPA